MLAGGPLNLVPFLLLFSILHFDSTGWMVARCGGRVTEGREGNRISRALLLKTG